MTDADRIATLTDYLRGLATRCSRLSQSALDDGIAWISDEIRDVLAASYSLTNFYSILPIVPINRK